MTYKGEQIEPSIRPDVLPVEFVMIEPGQTRTIYSPKPSRLFRVDKILFLESADHFFVHSVAIDRGDMSVEQLLAPMPAAVLSGAPIRLDTLDFTDRLSLRIENKDPSVSWLVRIRLQGVSAR